MSIVFPASNRHRAATSRHTLGIVFGVTIAAFISGIALVAAWLLVQRAEPTLWLIARSSGITSYALLTLVTVSGLLLSSRLLSGRLLPWRTQILRTHIVLTGLTLALVVTHIVALATDPWAKVGWIGSFVPFTADYRPVAVTLGVAALWLGMAIGLSAALAGRSPDSSLPLSFWLPYSPGFWPIPW